MLRNKRKLGSEFIAPYKFKVNVPHPPTDPFYLVEPVDFTPFVKYEPTITEYEYKIPIPFNGLQYLDLFPLLATGQLPCGTEEDVAEKYADILMDVESAAQEKKKTGDRIQLIDPFDEPQSSDSPVPPTSPSKDVSVASNTNLYVPHQQETIQELRHPDRPELKAVSRVPLQLNSQISTLMGSVYFEDEVPDQAKIQHSVLKAVNDPSLPSCTAGWLYSKAGDCYKLHREYEMEQSTREYDLIAIGVPGATDGSGNEAEQQGIIGEIKETFVVRKRTKAISRDEEEEMEDLKVVPDPELVSVDESCFQVNI